MATKQVNHDLDLQNTARLKNIPASTVAGEAVEHNELNTKLSAKQDNLTGGSGVNVDGSNVSIDLSSSANDYSSLTLSGATDSSLNGAYTRASYDAYLDYKPATDGDYDLIHSTNGLFAFYYKNNNNGTWDVIGVEDTDGVPNSNNQWSAFRVVTDPTSVTGNVTDFVLNSNAGVGGVKFDITNSHEQDDTFKKVPSSSDSNVNYGAGASDSYLSFDNGKLKVDVTQDTTQATTTNILSGGAVKTYIDEQDVISRSASNNTYSNSSSNYPSNPTNVQSALEQAKALIDSNTSNVGAVQAVNSGQASDINDLFNKIGGGAQTTMGTWLGSGAIFLSGANTAKEGIEGAATGAVTALSALGTVLGLSQGETDFGTGFTILPNNEDAKALFQAVELELQSLASGAGATWAAKTVQSVQESNIADLSNPATDMFGGETLSQGDVFLLAGQTAQSENGFYVFDTTSTPLVRWSEADASEDFIQNRSVQIVSDGTEWAYKGIAEPTVDTNILPFENIRDSIVADGAINENKLDTTLANKVNAKVDKYGDSVALTASVESVVSHNLATAYPMVQVYGDTDFVEDYTIRYIDVNSVGVTSANSETVKVVIV